MAFPTKKLPGYVHRHRAAGDTTNMEVRLPGGPDPDRRPYLGEPPASGFPAPGGATYPLFTTLVGFGEEASSSIINRALYQLHCSLDAAADQPIFAPKQIKTLGPSAAPDYGMDLSDVAIWGAWANSHLVYLGPPDTTAADAARFVALRNPEDLPLRSEKLVIPKITNITAKPGGVSLYPLTMLAGYFPDGLTGKVLSFHGLDQIKLVQVDIGGPDTGLLPLEGCCLFNYSLFTRSPFYKAWEAFASVTGHGIPNPASVNHDLAGAGWEVDDVIYLTTVALAPFIVTDLSFEFQTGAAVYSGGLTRVRNPDDPGAAAAMVGAMGPRDLTPPIIGAIPDIPVVDASCYALDPWNALFRAELESPGHASKVGFVARTAAKGYGFAHVTVKAFAANTVLDSDPSLNPALVAAPGGVLQLTGVANKWGDFVGDKSEIIFGRDFVEVWQDFGGALGQFLGAYRITSYISDTEANVEDLGGAVGAASIPAGSYFVRVVRPHLISTVTEGFAGTLALIGSSTPDRAALELVNGGTYHFLAYKRLASGQRELTAGLEASGGFWAKSALDTDGSISAGTRIDAAGPVVAGTYVEAASGSANGFRFTLVETVYHHVPIAAGTAVDAAGLKNWVLGAGLATDVAWSLEKAVAAETTDVLVFPVNLPDGVTITQFRAQYYIFADVVGAQPAVVKLVSREHGAAGWDVGSYLSPGLTELSTISCLLKPDAGHHYRVFEPDPALVPVVVNNKENEYFVLVRGDMDADQNDELHAIRLVYTWPRVTGV